MKAVTKEKIYLALPVFLQNLLVTMAGLIERKRRYSGVHDSMLKEINDYISLSNNDKKRTISLKVKELLGCAIRNVEYYAKAHVENDIHDFQVLTKDIIRKNSNELTIKDFPENKMLKINTGGSSGTPLQVTLSKSCRQKSYAFWSKFYESMGVTNKSKKLSLVGRKVCRPTNENPPFWRYAYLTNQMVLSNFHLSKEFIRAIIEEMNKFKPEIIEGYAQSIVNLSRLIAESGIELNFTPKCISVSSESFSDDDRCLMESVFGCKVYNQYGSAETVVFAYECSHGTMHFNELYGYVEVREKDGSINDIGTGDIIVTGLLNDTQPLIRYEIGDTGTVAYKECECGTSSKCLVNLAGRIGDSLIVGDRSIPAAAVSLFFKYSPELTRAQVVSYKGEHLEVLVESNSGEIDFAPIVTEVNKSVSSNVNVIYKQVEKILPEANGKYKLVKNVH